jgi:hypothetical protein
LWDILRKETTMPCGTHVDARRIQNANLQNLIAAAQRTLGARENAFMHKVEVVGAPIHADTSGVRSARLQDQLDVRHTAGVQSALTRHGPGIALPKSGDYEPLPLEAFIADAEMNGHGVRLVAQMTADKLKGVDVSIYEHVDEVGNVSHHLAVHSHASDGLVDHDGNWADPESKAAYEAFFAETGVDIELDQGAGDEDVSIDAMNAIDEALHEAGLSTESPVEDESVPQETAAPGKTYAQ